MELLKIKPLSISTRRVIKYMNSRHPFFEAPKKVNIIFSDAKKYHVLILSNGKKYYSFQLNAILECLDFNLTEIKNLALKEEVLTFDTSFGSYVAGTLIECNNDLSL